MPKFHLVLETNDVPITNLILINNLALLYLEKKELQEYICPAACPTTLRRLSRGSTKTWDTLPTPT